MPRVLLAGRRPEGDPGLTQTAFLETMRSRAPEVELLYADTREQFLAAIADVDAAIPGAICPGDDALFERSPRLRLAATFGSGIDFIDVAAATRHGVLVTNNAGTAPWGVVEHIVALMICLNKNLVHGDRLLRAGGRWPSPMSLMGHELPGRTLSIIGLGAIGRKLAQLCSAGFGMDVAAYSPRGDAATAASVGARLVPTLDDALRIGDFVSLNCPVTPETYHMIGWRELSLMKRSAFLVQVARGQLIVQSELTRALREGLIAGAGLDSFEPEPGDTADELFHLDNVITTPHIGGVTEETLRRVGLGTAESLVEVLVEGRRPARLANPQVWEAYERRWALV